MKLFTKAIETKLKKAGYDGNKAICKIFNPYGGQTWIIFGQDPEYKNRLWCVADLNMGCVEFGTVLRSELEEIRVKPFNLPLERDLYFNNENQPISFFTERDTLRGV